MNDRRKVSLVGLIIAVATLVAAMQLPPQAIAVASTDHPIPLTAIEVGQHRAAQAADFSAERPETYDKVDAARGTIDLTLTDASGHRRKLLNVPIVPASRQKSTRDAAKRSAKVSALTAEAPSPPFTTCPAVGENDGCQFLIYMSSYSVIILEDTSQGSYTGDGTETLWGMVNDGFYYSPSGWSFETATGGHRPFAFQDRGICKYGVSPCGETGYEGPGMHFADVNAAKTSGSVLLDAGGQLDPGESIYWSLQDRSGPVSEPAPTTAEYGGSPNPREPECACNSDDPVNLATGRYWLSQTDVDIETRGTRLKLVRTYDSGTATKSNRFGHGWHDTYSTRLRLEETGDVTLVQENGSKINFELSPNGWFTSASRVQSTLERRADGSYSLFDFQTRQTRYFASDGTLQFIEDENGTRLTLDYRGGNIASVSDSSGRTISFEYDDRGRVVGVTDPMNRKSTYTYDSNGNLESATNPINGVWRFHYDADHRMLAVTDPRGGTVTSHYDPLGRVAKQIDQAGNATIFDYVGDPAAISGGTTTMSEPGGKVTTQRYEMMRLQSVTHASGSPVAGTTSYRYDEITGQVIEKRRPSGATTKYSWNGQGMLTGMVDPQGNYTSYAYDMFGRQVSTTGPLGRTTSTTYNQLGEPVTRSLSSFGSGAQLVTRYLYEDSLRPSDLTAIIDPNGHQTTLSYDEFGNVVTEINAAGDATSYEYNRDSELVATIDGSGDATTLSRDAAGRVIASTDAGGHVTEKVYDFHGNLVQATSPRGKVTRYQYDALDRLTEVHRPDGATLLYIHDARGNKIGFVNGKGAKTSYEYDLRDRLVKVVDPLDRVVEFSYDADGNLTTKVQAGGTIRYRYDENGRKVAASFSNPGMADVTYEYNQAGDRVTMTDGSGITSYDYDTFGRVVAITGGSGAQVSYQLDNVGNATAIEYPDGSVVERRFDHADRLVALTDSSGGQFSFSYGPGGNLSGLVYPNGLATSLDYDADDEVTSITLARESAQIAEFSYIRNADGQVLTEAPAEVDGESHISYTYGATGNLVSKDGASYNYSPANELTQLASGISTSVDAAGQLVSLQSVDGQRVPIEFDEYGNRLNGVTGVATAVDYEYNQAGSLVRAVVTSDSAKLTSSYIYNGDGLRVGRTRDAVTYEFAWDHVTGGGVPLLLSDGTHRFVYGPDGIPLEQIDGAGVHTYLHHDQYRSTRLLSNDVGEIVGSFTYAPFGELVSRQGTTDTRLRWGGQYQDERTGLYYLRARYFDPVTGTFLTRDPLEELTEAPYSYASNDPLNQADPLGMWGWDWNWDTAATVLSGVSMVAGVGVYVAAATGNAPLAVALEGVSVATGAAAAAIGCRNGVSTGCGLDLAAGGLGVAGGAVRVLGSTNRISRSSSDLWETVLDIESYNFSVPSLALGLSKLCAD